MNDIFSRVTTLLALAGAVASCGSSSANQDGGVPDGSKPDSPGDAPHVDRLPPPTDGGKDSGCPSGKSSCGGTCVDEQTDNANCGGCGLTCAMCVKGSCTTTLGTPSQSPWAIAVDSKNVYFTSLGGCATDGGAPSGMVGSIPIGGGAIVTIASAQGSPSAIAVDSKSIYWVNKADCSGNGSVVKIGLDGSGMTTLAANQKQAQNIALDSANVYWTTSDGVLSIPLDGVAEGGAPTTLASMQGSSAGVAVEGTEVFWAQTGSPYAVNSVPVSGGMPKKLTAACGSAPCADVAGLAADSKNVYWSPLPSATYATYYIVTEPIGGGALNTIASNQGIPADIASDGKTVYWTTYGMTNGLGDTVAKVPIGGGMPTTLASKQPNPRGIAVDATSVYWANSGAGGTLMKMTPK